MTTMIDFEDLQKNLPNGENMGGLPQVVYYGRYEDVAGWPARPTAGNGINLTAMGELTGNLVMKAGKFLHRLYMTDGEGKLDFEGVGETDGKSFVAKLRVYHPGLNSKFLGLINLAKNANLVFIVPDNNGNLFLLGDEMRAAVLDSIDALTTGQKTEERPGGGLVFSFKTANIYRYKGVVPLAEGNIEPKPEPEPGPGNGVMACCPDGVNDYFSIQTPTSENIGLLFPDNGEEIIFTIDLVPVENALFTFGQKDTYSVRLIYSGDHILLRAFVAGNSVGADQEMKVNNHNKRVLLKLVLSNETGFHCYVNGTEEILNMGDISESMPARPATDFFYLFREESDNDAYYGNTKLISFKIDKKRNNVFTPLVNWDFEGATVTERLKNKVEGKEMFDLVANNILNLDEVIKLTEVGELPAQDEQVMVCSPDGADDFFSITNPAEPEIAALYPSGAYVKLIYTIDVIADQVGSLFSICHKDKFYLCFMYNGAGVNVIYSFGGKTMVIMHNAQTDNSGKRVCIKFSISKVNTDLSLGLVINGEQENLVATEVPESSLQMDTNFFHLFKSGQTENNYGNYKLISLTVEKEFDGLIIPMIKWDFEGNTNADRLKNKIIGFTSYDLLPAATTAAETIISATRVEKLPAWTENKPVGMVCCPDGTDDYLSVDVNLLSKLLIVPANGEKINYIMDLVPGGIVFSFAVSGSMKITFAHFGNSIQIGVYCNNKGYTIQKEASLDCSGKRVLIRFELSIIENLPVARLYVDNQEEVCTFAESANFAAPAADNYTLFTNLENSFFNGKLYAMSINKITANGTYSEALYYNFKGDTDALKLKNKIGSYFGLTAHNVANMGEFIKQEETATN